MSKLIRCIRLRKKDKYALCGRGVYKNVPINMATVLRAIKEGRSTDPICAECQLKGPFVIKEQIQYSKWDRIKLMWKWWLNGVSK